MYIVYWFVVCTNWMQNYCKECHHGRYSRVLRCHCQNPSSSAFFFFDCLKLGEKVRPTPTVTKTFAGSATGHYNQIQQFLYKKINEYYRKFVVFDYLWLVFKTATFSVKYIVYCIVSSFGFGNYQKSFKQCHYET